MANKQIRTRSKYGNFHTNIKNISRNLDWGNYFYLLGSGNGLCYGLTHMWGQAFLANDEQTFFQRMDCLTKDYSSQKGGISAEIRWAQELINSSTEQELSKFTSKTKSLLTIRQFLDGLLAYHRPGKSSLRSIGRKQNFNLFSNYLANEKISTKRVKKVLCVPALSYERTYHNILADLIYGLNDLHPSQRALITMTANRHIVGLSVWGNNISFYDANFMGAPKGSSTTYFRKTEDLLGLEREFKPYKYSNIDSKFEIRVGYAILEMYKTLYKKNPKDSDGKRLHYLNSIIEVYIHFETELPENTKDFFELIKKSILDKAINYKNENQEASIQNYLLNLCENDENYDHLLKLKEIFPASFKDKEVIDLLKQACNYDTHDIFFELKKDINSLSEKDIYKIFGYACAYDSIKIFRELRKKHKFNLYNSASMTETIIHDSLKIFKLMFKTSDDMLKKTILNSVDDINTYISLGQEKYISPFYLACFYNSVNILEHIWYSTLSSVDLTASKTILKGFECACKGKALDIVEFFLLRLPSEFFSKNNLSAEFFSEIKNASEEEVDKVKFNSLVKRIKNLEYGKTSDIEILKAYLLKNLNTTEKKKKLIENSHTLQEIAYYACSRQRKGLSNTTKTGKKLLYALNYKFPWIKVRYLKYTKGSHLNYRDLRQIALKNEVTCSRDKHESEFKARKRNIERA